MCRTELASGLEAARVAREPHDNDVVGARNLRCDDATETLLARPFGIEFDAAGALYIADTINSRILRVAP